MTESDLLQSELSEVLSEQVIDLEEDIQNIFTQCTAILNSSKTHREVTNNSNTSTNNNKSNAIHDVKKHTKLLYATYQRYQHRADFICQILEEEKMKLLASQKDLEGQK